MTKGSWVIRLGGGFIVACVALAAWGVISGRAGSQPSAVQTPAPVAQVPTAAPAPLIQYTAGDLARAYEQNSVAADAKFKGKRFKVSGTVAEISTDFMGDPYITLKGGVNQFLEPHFGFDKKQLEQIGKLRKGQKVNLACEGKGDAIKAALSGDCALI